MIDQCKTKLERIQIIESEMDALEEVIERMRVELERVRSELDRMIPKSEQSYFGER